MAGVDYVDPSNDAPVPGPTNAIRVHAKADVQTMNAVTGVLISSSSFGAGNTNNFAMTVVDGQPHLYAMVVRRQDGSIYKLIGSALTSDGTVVPVAIGNGQTVARSQ